MANENEQQLSFITCDVLGLVTIKAEYRLNKKERPTIRTRTEVKGGKK